MAPELPKLLIKVSKRLRAILDALIEQASRFRYGKTTASARKVPYQITSSNYNHILRCVALALKRDFIQKYHPVYHGRNHVIRVQS